MLKTPSRHVLKRSSTGLQDQQMFSGLQCTAYKIYGRNKLRKISNMISASRFITSHNSYLRKRSKSEEANTECICVSNDLW